MPSKRADRASDAIDLAKSSFAPVVGERPVTSDLVLLREVMFALQCLWGYSDDELRYGEDPKSAYALLRALKHRDLVARVYREGLPAHNCPIIPVHSWPELPDAVPASFSEPDSPDMPWPGRAATALSDFWVSHVFSDQDCRGYVGELPVVPRGEATVWLARAGVSRDFGAWPVHHTRADTERAFTNFVDEYSGRTPPNQKEREAWAVHNGLTRKRLRELVQEFAPPEWRRPGRRRRPSPR